MREWCNSGITRSCQDRDGRSNRSSRIRSVARGSARAALHNRGDNMTLTSDNDVVATTTAVVTIRIPCGADGDLITDAEERLAQATETADVTIDELYSLDPKLSATAITVGVTMGLTTPMTDAEVREVLADVPGLKSVDRFC